MFSWRNHMMTVQYGAGKTTYDVSAKIDRVPWKMNAAGQVEYTIDAKTKKWLDDQFYGTLGKSAFWEAINCQPGVPQFGAVVQYVASLRVSQVFKRVRRVPKVKPIEAKHNFTNRNAMQFTSGRTPVTATRTF